MLPTPPRIKRIYYTLLLGNTLAASLIWGINTIFLLDAGLTNLEAFAANAFFTAGMVVFEVPTGVIADTAGRRMSYLLGTVTLMLSTLLYVLLWRIRAPFWMWAVCSVLLGLGFTFYSGAFEAWLVDALKATGYTGSLEAVLGRGQVVGGIAMLIGSVAGGYVAQVTNLGLPFVLRAVILGVMFVLAFLVMKDLGFTPHRGGRPLGEMRKIVSASVQYGWRVPAVKWTMLSSPFSAGVSIYAFYALQPYLLQLYGKPTAYGIAGLAAAIVAGAQIAGGLTAPWVRKLFRRRTSALIASVIASVVTMAGIGLSHNFWIVLALVVIWGLLFSATIPIRQAFLNGLIPSQQRATILSFDSLVGSSGGVIAQPVLGRSADVWSYGTSYVLGAAIELMAVPFIVLSQRQNAPADTARDEQPPMTARPEEPKRTEATNTNRAP
ncbi:MFS transporter [Vitiosangium sp. GDMCC 1.1324]|nr:MFS transporter [Vitiosangium sp. GDMCC 1.1324]